MRLYEIEAAIDEVITKGWHVDESSGEYFDASDLDKLNVALDDKLEGCALYTKDLMSDAAAIRAEEKALADRRHALENRAERMREYVAFAMERANKERFETARCKLSFRASTRVEIDDEAAIPPKFLKVVESPDKAAIKAAVKAGEDVPGASVVACRNLQVK